MKLEEYEIIEDMRAWYQGDIRKHMKWDFDNEGWFCIEYKQFNYHFEVRLKSVDNYVVSMTDSELLPQYKNGVIYFPLDHNYVLYLGQIAIMELEIEFRKAYAIDEA